MLCTQPHRCDERELVERRDHGVHGVVEQLPERGAGVRTTCLTSITVVWVVVRIKTKIKPKKIEKKKKKKMMMMMMKMTMIMMKPRLVYDEK